MAWYSDHQTHDVKTKFPNELGLYDMSGNVREWCWDWYGDYNSGAQTNPTGASWGSYRVLRGGGWRGSDYRVADRSLNTPFYTSSDLGFRVVRTDVESLKQPEKSQSSEAIPDSTVSVLENDYILVEGGSFSMGSTLEFISASDEKPVHKVAVSSFYMSDHEVTQAEYMAVMGSNPSGFSGGSSPVEIVSWYDAIEYCNKLSEMKGLSPCYSLNGTTDTSKWGKKGDPWDNVVCDFTANGYRLPTEAEWEYAARGGNKSNGYIFSGSNGYTTYSGIYDIGSVAWCDEDWGSTHDIKTKQPNELGLYDMSGNVREWCWDWYGSYDSSAQANPTGASSGRSRVYRGGGWLDTLWECRVANRDYSRPGYAFSDLGFRVVRTAK